MTLFLRRNLYVIASITLAALFALAGIASGQEVFHHERQVFWKWDLSVMPPKNVEKEFVLKGEKEIADGVKVLVWLETELGEHTPTDEALKDLVDVLATKTPAASVDPARGSLPIQIDIFGNPPTPPSKDPNIHVLVARLDPFERNGKVSRFDGYFNAFDQMPNDDAMVHGQRSNERNIIYVNVLHDISTDYMKGVTVHELNHLLTFQGFSNTNADLPGWLNEMLGESVMSLSGYYTDVKHASSYLRNTHWPVTVEGYGVSYGALAVFSNFLIKEYDPKNLGRITKAVGGGFDKLVDAYGQSWNKLFEQYIRWLIVNADKGVYGAPENSLKGIPHSELKAKMKIPPTGIRFYKEEIAAKSLNITSTAESCRASKNEIRQIRLQDVTAVWIESSPPCVATHGRSRYEKSAFVLNYARNDEAAGRPHK